jgi:tetratricopeptide (TPR) repeat protein
MNWLSRTDIPEFNLLCIGQRGVGKTVFLAGSYLELQTQQQASNSQSYWMECRDAQGKENLQSILDYVARMNAYPPPTMKVTDFRFDLKSYPASKHGNRSDRKPAKTLCHFNWWDIPGECCNLRDGEFQKIILESHSCCVLIDGEALVKDPSYLETMEEITKQIIAIASLVSQQGIDYAFALIFTKCDLLEPSAIAQLQIEENLQPFLARLDAVNTKYHRFYSSIPIATFQNTTKLKATGASEPIVWLLSELNKSRQLQGQSTLAHSLKQNTSLKRSSAVSTRPLTNARQFVPLLILSSFGVLAVSAALFFTANNLSPSQRIIAQYETILQEDPTNLDALTNLAELYIKEKDEEKAIPILEKIVQQPTKSFDWHFVLAELYKRQGDRAKEESIYDRILEQENDLQALLQKAELRAENKDLKTAKILFNKAEEVAPNDIAKSHIRSLAASFLQETSN